MLSAGGVEEGEEGGAGAHLDEDVLAGEIGEVGVVLVDEPLEGELAASGGAGFCHDGQSSGWAGGCNRRGGQWLLN